MSVQPKARMTVDEFLAWAEHQPGRYELVNGEVYAMSPQRARHARTKYVIQAALERAIRERGLPCRMLPDGMTVRVDRSTAYEPDALVYCGNPLDGEAIEVSEPVIVVEVLSPSTGNVDTGEKLAGYFRVASVVHYLVVDPKNHMVIHHRRGAEDLIETRIVSIGTLDLSPPGLSLSLDEIFADL
ncbi:Uma2 family endonuclease [Methylobacterium iners]|uniref:Putative restriction endonuclease domain-containing protein n=1 Tax=Methylobacterium iners TaxID=418707 RepID=A0ABQ4RU81_9HYPH|nr:Uma2 family endonuclease [Methylobacterium iners]GJD93784.1 hypothetical protein OCOJLMKI_0982 [Methylobacterium iners]